MRKVLALSIYLSLQSVYASNAHTIASSRILSPRLSSHLSVANQLRKSRFWRRWWNRRKVSTELNVMVTVIAELQNGSFSILCKCDNTIFNLFVVQGPLVAAGQAGNCQLRKRRVNEMPLFILILVRQQDLILCRVILGTSAGKPRLFRAVVVTGERIQSVDNTDTLK